MAATESSAAPWGKAPLDAETDGNENRLLGAEPFPTK
jgi:hypothetical protein